MWEHGPGAWVDPACPVEWGHPLARGLEAWLLGLPNPGWWGGQTFRDVTRGAKTPHDGDTLLYGSSVPSWVAGPNGFPGLRFSDTTQRVDGSVTLGSQITLSCWVSLTNSGFYAGLFVMPGTGDHAGLMLNASDRKVMIGNGSSFVGGPTVLTLGQWYHIAGTFDGGLMTSYVNGRYDVSDTFTAISSATAYRLNRDNTIADAGALPRIADARIYSRALSAGEVAALYDQSRRGHPDTLRWVSSRAWSIPAAAGGTTYDLSLTENLGTQNPYARISDGKRSYNESLGIREVYARLSDGKRVYTDTTALLDVYARVADGKRAFGESLGINDVYARVSDGKRNESDSLGINDVYARVSDGKRSHAESLGINESYQRLADAVRTSLDSLGINDLYSRTSTASRAESDSVGASDAYQRVSDGLRRLTDTMALADVVTLVRITAGVYTIAVVELLGITESYGRTANANRAHSDSLGINEVYGRLVTVNRLMTDTIACVEAYSSTVVWGRGLSDSLGISEAYQRLATASRSLLDSLGINETYGRRADASRVYIDWVGLAMAVVASTPLLDPPEQRNRLDFYHGEGPSRVTLDFLDAEESLNF